MDCGYIYFSSDGGHKEFYCNSRGYTYRGHKIRRTHVPGINGKGIYQIDNEPVDTSDKVSLTTLKKVKEYIDKRYGTEKAPAPTNKRNSNDICSLINKIDEVVKDGRECHIKIEIDIK